MRRPCGTAGRRYRSFTSLKTGIAKPSSCEVALLAIYWVRTAPPMSVRRAGQSSHDECPRGVWRYRCSASGRVPFPRRAARRVCGGGTVCAGEAGIRPVPVKGDRLVRSRGQALAERYRVDGVSVGRERELVSDAAVDGALLHRQPLVQILRKANAGRARAPFHGLGSPFRAPDAAASPSLESSRALDSRLA